MQWQSWLKRGLNGLILLLVAWLLLAAAYVSLGRQFVPAIANYKTELLRKAESISGRHIRLQSLSAQMQGAQPVFRLRGLQVHADTDPASPTLFALDNVTARLDLWRSLWKQRLVMDALQVEGLALSISEDAEGQWHLRGLGQQAQSLGGLEQAVKMLREQRRITLLDTEITVSPYDAPRWQFQRGELTLINGAGWQRLDGRLRLPDGELVRWQVSGLLDNDNLADLSLGFFLELPASDWSRWLPQGWLQRSQLKQLIAGGRFWGSWQDQRLQRLQGTLVAPQISFERPETPALQDIHSRFAYRYSETSERLLVQDLSLRIDEQVWPMTRIQAERAAPEGDWSLAVDTISLDRLRDWLPRFVDHPPMAELVTALAPQGRVRNLHLSGHGSPTDVDALQFSANLEKVGFQAYQNAPLLQGISGSISGSPHGGELRVDNQLWSMQLPNLFPEVWQYQSALGALNWSWSRDDGLQLHSDGMSVGTEQGEGTALVQLHLPPAGQTPTMDLRVALRDTQAQVHRRYLPLRAPAFSPQLANWLAASGIQGKVPLAIFSYSGSLLKGATEEERQIGLYAELREGELLFQRGWPLLTEVNADLRLQQGRLDIRGEHARLWQTDAEQIQLNAQLLNRSGPLLLQVAADFAGPAGDALKLMQETPLRELSKDPLSGWSVGGGQVKGELALHIPLQSGAQAQTQADVSWQLEADNLMIPQLQAPLRKLAGNFTYSREQGLNSDDLSATFLGAPVKARLHQHEGTQRVSLSGSHSVEQLRGWALASGVPAGLAAGKFAWQAEIEIAAQQQRVQINSDLQGLALTLPQPFGKQAQSVLPTEVELRLSEGTQHWHVATASGLDARLLRRDEELSGELRYSAGPASAPQAQGLAVVAQLPQLDWEQWQNWLQQLPGSTGESGSRGAVAMLRRADVTVGEFTGLGLTLPALQVEAQRQAKGWQVAVAQAEVAGDIYLPDSPNLPIDINLQHLALGATDQQAAELLPAMRPEGPAPDSEPSDPLEKIKPSRLPPLNVQIAQLSWGGDPVGQVAFTLRPDSTGAQIPELSLDLRGLKVEGRMDWREAPAHSVFEGSVSAEDIGQVLTAWKYAPTITSEQFVTRAQLNWPGSPAMFSLRRSSGSLEVAARDGMLQSGENGTQALRVFGLLNFNSLTRRLRLDFSDLFSKGTAYDTLDGQLYADNGVLHSEKPVVLEGPGVKMQFEGNLDLRNDQVDLGVLVTLPVTNNLPLAALIAGAPQIGGVLFLADKILGDKVARFASVKYKVSGDWMQPDVEFDRAFDDKAALEAD
ncbi:MAG: YhdP family protein [Halopseudomonas sp.]|uniref:YhdP family protein n=1 Tax=Halopseudomonas sp. TaxID=2901191 RepID=UPI0030036C20